MMDEIFDILSLFTGGGFLDIGFFNNGFQVKESVEIEEAFIYGHNAGFESYFAHSDNYYIRNNLVVNIPIARSVDASKQDEINRLGIMHRNITGIVGGPPCQDYSTGGKNAGATGDKGKLIFSYYKIVEQVMPQFIFFENVTGLVNTKIHKEEGFDMLVSKLKKLGYEVWYDILNSLEFGLPQDRPRVVLVGFRRDVVDLLTDAGYHLEKDNQKLKTENRDDVVFKWPLLKYTDTKKQNWPTKWNFGSKAKTIEINSIPKEYRKMMFVDSFDGLTSKTPNQNEHFQPKSTRFYSVAEGDTNRKSFKRLHRFRFSPTVAYGNNEVHLHPTEPRRLTVREALRLQTVPDIYILPNKMTLTAKFKMISNGVPTKKAELIAQEIRRTLLLYNKVQNGNL
jgi:DNA (cytosine-5)-methyltransferase 1